jgi:hypothetical protein
VPGVEQARRPVQREEPGTAMKGMRGMKGLSGPVPLIPCSPFIALPRCSTACRWTGPLVTPPAVVVRDMPLHRRDVSLLHQQDAIMLATIAIVLLVLWVLGFVVFKVTATVIHLLIILAVVALVMHFMRGRAPRV